MTKKSIIFGELLLIIFFSFCSPTNEKYTIGILFDSYNAPRFQKEKIYFEEKIAELGGSSIIMSANGNEIVQEHQAKELIDEGIDVLIIIANNVNRAGSIVRYAHRNGIKVIAYDRLIRNCDLDLYFSFDGDKVGQLLAKYVIEKAPEGNYVLFNGDNADENATIFYNGTQKILQPLIDNGRINIVYKAYVDEWSDTEAAFLMNKILELSSKKIDVIISQYDGLSKGAIKALAEKNIEEEVIVTGQDAEIDACKRILNGTQSMTIYKPVKIMAYKCIEVAFDLRNSVSSPAESNSRINNGRVNVPTFLFEPIIVDKNNLNLTVVKDGFLSMEEIVNYN